MDFLRISKKKADADDVFQKNPKSRSMGLLAFADGQKMADGLAIFPIKLRAPMRTPLK